MKALRLMGPNDLKLMDVELPPLPAGWCKIRVLRTAVCASDISSIAGALPFTKYPITPGHEFSGVVAEVNGCSRVKPGMFVTANPIFTCGECEPCKKGELNHCTKCEVLGVVSHDGAYAEEVMVPEHMVFELPDTITPEEGSLVEPTVVALTALKRACVKEGSTLAVFGAGNIGLPIISIAKAWGAKRILAVDTVPARLEIAKKMGADEAVTTDYLSANIEKYQDQFTSIIDSVGIAPIVELAVKLMAYGGHIDIYGVPKGSYVVPVQACFVKDGTISTSRLYGYDMTEAIDIVAKKYVNFDAMITQRMSLAEFADFSKKMVDKSADFIKVIVEVAEK